MIRTVAMLIPEFPSQTHAFFWREIKALESLGVRVVVVSTRRPTTKCCHDFASAAMARTHYVFPPRVRYALTGGLRALPRLNRAYRYISSLHESSVAERLQTAALVPCSLDLADFCRREHIDHVHVHSCSQAAHIAALAFHLGGAPFSLHLHGDLPVYGKDHRSKMRHAAFVAAAARPMECQAVQTAGVPQERACTRWMGVETDRMLPSHARESGQTLRIVTVGRLNRVKGHAFVLRAVANLIANGTPVHYTIVGSGPWEAEIRKTVATLRLDAHVEFTGSLGEAEVLSVLHRSEVFVLASIGLGEASPVAVMEAMSAGLPVICSRIGGTPEMIEPGVDGVLIDQQDVDGIVGALDRMAKDPAWRESLGRAARRRAVEQFDVRRTAERLLEAINLHHSRSLNDGPTEAAPATQSETLP